ncbi:pirin family protein [Falsiroseomonas oryzae]|uniref:pirin family protein n=1 Tax=Falsiroseomonas oryzae TaxID=2766473 RepID=UPI0022EB4948|nr:pirin family protein [Roseomonas sp. MO-31]
MTDRAVIGIHPALRDDIGDLVTRRPLPGPGLDQVDPFLFLNHHGPQTFAPGNQGLPFGPHPHRGFETVTFILDGELAHLDSGGHESVIRAGGVQWMTAGRGLVHAEISPESSRRSGGPLEILQLWVNLPARLKMTEPAYVGLQRADIPALPTDGGRVTVELIAGAWEGREGPIRSLTGVHMAVLRCAPGGRLDARVAPGRSVFLYVVRGALEVSGRLVEAFHLATLDDAGDTVPMQAGEGGAVVLFGHAEPCREPVVAHGPFVMNTREEVAQAVRDYQAGRFGGLAVR